MGTRKEFNVISFVLNALIGVGIVAMLAALPMGTEDGPLPVDQLAHKKRLATLVLFTGGGVAALAAFGRYAIDRPRRGPLEEEARR
jgi:hypothetical protein